MIAYCFPGRSRNMIKNKYNRESQLYGGRLEEALATRKPVGESGRMSDRDTLLLTFPGSLQTWTTFR
jgi:hypothetical protein